MKISSKEVPQADNLNDVIKSVLAVSKGAQTYQSIATAIGKVERQGRYYRLAAELLGFIDNEPNGNCSKLTYLGKKFVHSDKEHQEQLLLMAVLNNKLIQRLLPFFESEKVISRDKFKIFIDEITDPVGPSMIPRRLSTIISWLNRVGLIAERENGIVFLKLPKMIDLVDFKDDTEPLLPQKFDLKEYRETSERIKKAGSYSLIIDIAKKERANSKHERLTKLVAQRIREAGSVPRRNKFIDLATQYANRNFIFEMKSSTDDNIHSQVRKGISQLYEYKYLEKIDRVELVLVIENKPDMLHEWLIDYLVKDRNIAIIWDGNNEELFCPRNLKNKLSFLNPNFV